MHVGGWRTVVADAPAVEVTVPQRQVIFVMRPVQEFMLHRSRHEMFLTTTAEVSCHEVATAAMHSKRVYAVDDSSPM